MEDREKAVTNFFNTNTYLTNVFNIKIRTEIIKELLKDHAYPEKVLDIGCGDGSLSIMFAKRSELVLVDIAENMLNKAKENLEKVQVARTPAILKGNIFTLEIEEKFDLILCIGVVAHSQNTEQLVKRIYDLLLPNGKAIIQVSDSEHFRYKKFDYKYGPGYELNKISKNKFKDLLLAQNLTVLAEKGYSWSFRPLVWLPQSMQFLILNTLRKFDFFNYLNSEWMFLIEKNK